MIKVNILFDDEYEDTDIIVVPKELSDKIATLANEFLHWTGPKDDKDYWGVDEKGNYFEIAETVGFIKWLNTFYCKGEKKAYVVAQHIAYDFNDYPTIEF